MNFEQPQSTESRIKKIKKDSSSPEKIKQLKVDESGVHESHYKEEKRALIENIKDFDLREINQQNLKIMKEREQKLAAAKTDTQRQVINDYYQSYFEALDLMKQLSLDTEDQENDRILENMAQKNAWKFHDIKNKYFQHQPFSNAIAWLDDSMLTLAEWKYPEEFKRQSEEHSKQQIAEQKEILDRLKVS